MPRAVRLYTIRWHLVPGVYVTVPIAVGSSRAVEEHIRDLKKQCEVANENVRRLSDELKVAHLCAQKLREERMQLSEDRLNGIVCSGAALGGCDEICSYITLGQQAKEVEAVMRTIKQECVSARSDREVLIAELRSFILWSESLGRLFGGRSVWRRADNAVFSAEKTITILELEDLAERIVEAENTAINVGGVVGAFGAGITYTTVFSATRGRLDLISGAFACFIAMIVNCAVVQVFAPPRQIQVTNYLRTWNGQHMPGFLENRLTAWGRLALPAIAGFILLALSLMDLDTTSPVAVPGSTSAIWLAGVLPLMLLGYFLFRAITERAVDFLISFVRRALVPREIQIPH